MPTARARSRKARPYHKGNVAEDLMEAASKLLKAGPVEDISVRRLTREVGVTPANFYNHFASLNDLLLNIAAEGFERRNAQAERIVARARGRRTALLEVAVMYADFALDNRELFRIMYGQIPNALSNERFRKATDGGMSIASRLIYGNNRHDVDNPSLSHRQNILAYAAAALVSGLCRNLVEDLYEFRSGKRSEIRSFVRDAVGAFIDGTAAGMFENEK
ncbi:MAG: TetR/AcrR family transcriptional regulator [Alphaproteobacteria bacterium]|nr:TetR/AcrR family transcriptional regulator [Alphaproteobacteria bacterium]